MISKILLLHLLLIGFGSSVKIVCYYQSWTIYYPSPQKTEPEDINPSMCTHINYAFASLKEDGNIEVGDQNADIDRGLFRRVVGLKEQNSNLKVLLSIGGGSAPIEIFRGVAADPAKRATMVKSARIFMEQYGFDGLDIDWEMPELQDKDNFIALLREIKTDFDKNQWELTAAVKRFPYDGYDVPQLNEILTHINIMTYDMYGPWSDYTGQNSPLYASSVESDLEKQRLNIDSSVTNWMNAGATADKIIVGIGFYGRSFTLADPNNNGIHAPITGAGTPGEFTGEEGGITYVEYCSRRDEWDCHWDDEQRVPICLKRDQWLGTDNIESIILKAQYIRDHNLGGAMIWSIDQDDNSAYCGEMYPLINAIHKNIA